MLNALELDYVQHLERGYCVNHPDVIALTKEQVVDRAVKQLLTALKALPFEVWLSGIQIGANGLLGYIDDVWKYSNDGGSTWHVIGEGGIPTEVDSPVTMGTLQLRDNAGAFELSDDAGVTWEPVGGGGTPDEVANPFTLGTILVQDGGGYLQTSEDAGVNWDDLVYANELTNAINNATRSQFLEQYTGYPLNGGFNVLMEAGTFSCPAGVEGEYRTIFALATGSMTITGVFKLGADNGTSLTVTATRADFVKMVYSAGGVLAAGWWILDSRGSWAVS